MIRIKQRGDFHKTLDYLGKLQKIDLVSILSKYGELGVAALASATPVDSGVTADSWYYEVVNRKGYVSLRWHNRHMVDGRPIAILIEYGHGTRNGGYVQGREYIMSSIIPIFEQIEEEIGREVTD